MGVHRKQLDCEALPHQDSSWEILFKNPILKLYMNIKGFLDYPQTKFYKYKNTNWIWKNDLILKVANFPWLHLVASQLSVVEINVITILRFYYLQRERKIKLLTWTEIIQLYELPVQKKLHCIIWKLIALSNSIHIFKKYLLNLSVAGTSSPWF